jgi:hypothetical protein
LTKIAWENRKIRIISKRVDLNEGFPVKVNGISTVPEEQVSKAE